MEREREWSTCAAQKQLVYYIFKFDFNRIVKKSPEKETTTTC